jgi:zinc transporter 1
VAIITLIYCVMELSAAVWIHSLTLMTDGFHKLSDVVSVFIAWWAIRAGKQSASFSMSYGWGRTEVVGSLTNAIFLLSLCLYILLDAIPQFIEPANRTGTKMGSLILTGVAGLGLLVNFVGTLIFAFTGQHHHHHHHGHDHGHDDHGHGDHGHKDHDHDHDHKEHEHGHDVEAGDSCRGSECKTAKKDKKDKKKKKHKMDLNIKAVFLHYLGDSITSIFVLLMGILLFFFGRPELTSSEVLSSGDTGVAKWVPYIDPATSILMIVFILFTTLPLTSECVRLLLQSAPEKMNARQLQRDLLRADGVLGAHALHVWEFTPGVVVCTVHIKYLEGTNANMIVRRVIKILHDNGIQHVTVQPEMVPAAQQSAQSSSGAAWQIDTVSHEESGSCVVKHIHK